MPLCKKFIAQLCQATSYEQAFTAYSDYMLALNFHSLSYVFMPINLFGNYKEQMPRFSVTDYFSPSFLEEYASCGFQSHDYIVDAVSSGKQNCLYLWAQDRKNGKLTKQAANIIDNAKYDHHMGNGCSILTSKSLHGVGAVSLIGDESDRLFNAYVKENFISLSNATEVFHNHVIAKGYEVNIFVMQTLFSDFNATEKKILKCLLDGNSVPETAIKVNRSKGHVENLVREMRIKIGGELPNGKPRISKDKLLHFCGLMHIYHEL
jgi:hypothetical protein